MIKTWSIAKIDQNERKKLFSESIAYLNNLLKPMDSGYKVNSFKAGSWALQPSFELFKDFTEYGIQIVMGIRKDMNINGLGIDYENLDEDTLPYYPNFNDIRKIGEKSNIVILPLSYVYPSWKDLMNFGFALYNEKRGKRKKLVYPFHENIIPQTIINSNPDGDKVRFRLNRNPYLTHLKIGGPRSLNYLINTFDQTIKRLSSYEENGIPIVIESHTKTFQNNYHDIEKFLEYIAYNYRNEIDFVTMTEYLKRVKDNQLSIRSKSK